MFRAYRFNINGLWLSCENSITTKSYLMPRILSPLWKIYFFVKYINIKFTLIIKTARIFTWLLCLEQQIILLCMKSTFSLTHFQSKDHSSIRHFLITRTLNIVYYMSRKLPSSWRLNLVSGRLFKKRLFKISFRSIQWVLKHGNIRDSQYRRRDWIFCFSFYYIGLVRFFSGIVQE